MIVLLAFLVCAIMIYSYYSQRRHEHIKQDAPNGSPATVINARKGGPFRFVTFEMEDGQRVELQVPNAQFGTYVVGDKGVLRYNPNSNPNTFVSFDRNI